MNARFWKNIWNKEKVTLDSFRDFVYVCNCVHLKRFAWKRDCPISSKLQTSRIWPRSFKKTLKSSFNIEYSYRRRTISGNWKPLKNHEKYFLFHLNKLNILMANQILHILWIFIKPNVWYSWLKTGFFNIFFKRLSKEVLKI